MSDQEVWASVIVNADDSIDVEFLDKEPAESFRDDLARGVTAGRIVRWQIRMGYMNGGDSRVEWTFVKPPSRTAREVLDGMADNDDSALSIREALMDVSWTADEFVREVVRDLDPQSLSELRLQYSLCPLHARDYAICFDDDDPECAAIREAFPNHDT